MASVVNDDRGEHKDCGGTVQEVYDRKNWPSEHVLVCRKCDDVVTQSEVNQ